MNEKTLCFLIRDEQVLLGMKKRGFGAGKYAGFGGGVEEGEGVETAVVRELYEETNLTVQKSDLQPGGKLHFIFPAKPHWNQIVHLYMATKWVGDPTESDEMQPVWFATNMLPFGQMWDDARYWLAEWLANQTINKTITFANDNETVAEVTHGTT